MAMACSLVTRGTSRVFGEGKINGVVGSEILAELPDPAQERRMSVSVESNTLKLLEGSGGHMLAQSTSEDHASQGARDFDIHQMWSCQIRNVQFSKCVGC